MTDEASATASTPNNTSIQRVAVIGAGTMGWQIAAMAAGAGYDVALYDAMPGAVQRAFQRMREQLPPILATERFPVANGRQQPELATLIGQIHEATSLQAAVTEVDLVIEVVRENLEVKRAVLTEISQYASKHALLATNSSSLPSSRIADVVADPSRFMNLHHFAPVWDRPMVEIMSCGQTESAIIERAAAYERSLGLYVAVCRGESMGFIINRVWRAIKRESLRVVDEGHADPDDVDQLFRRFFMTEVTPFQMMDMVGLDVVADIEAQYVAVTTDPADRVSPTLHRLIAEGRLGEKTGAGFYEQERET